MTLPKLKYKISFVTFIQFIVMSLLYFLINFGSIINTCASRSYDCVSNTISSLTLSILVVMFFGFVWMLGYFSEERRSRKIVIFLMLIELVIAGVELFDAHQFVNIFSFLTSLIDALLAIWVIVLGFGIYRAKGGRVVSKVSRIRKN